MSDVLSTSRNLARHWKAGVGGILLLTVAGVAGGVVGHAIRPAAVMAPVRPVPIATLAAQDDVVTIRGRVAEVHGSAIIAADGSGRALVDLGPTRDGTALVAVGQVVTIQGRYARGMLRPSFLVDAAGKVHTLARSGRKGGGDRGHGDRHGRRGSSFDRSDELVPPPAPTVGNAAAPGPPAA